MNVVEEYCWAITNTAGRSCCCPSRSSVLEFEFQLDCYVHTELTTCLLLFDLRKIRLAPDFLEGKLLRTPSNV
jgi:hypothetical protein